MKRSEMLDTMSKVIFKELKSASQVTENDANNLAETLLDLVEYYDMVPPDTGNYIEAHHAWDREEEFDSLDIYLKKDNQIIGLHAIGYSGPYEYDLVEIDGSRKTIKTNFQAIETFGNEYNENLQMIGKGSFRLHSNDIESEAEDLTHNEGWVRFKPELK